MSSNYSDIQPELDDFKNAVYGEEVRDSIVSAIKKIHDIAESAEDAVSALDPDTASAGQVLMADGNGGAGWGDVETGDSVPTEVRQALFTLLNNNAFANNDQYNSQLAVLQSWATEVTSVTVSPTTASLNGMETQMLSASTVPAGGIVTWSSSDENVAIVTGGLVESVGNGSCTITARCGNKTATCAVTVSGFQMRTVTNNLTNVNTDNSVTQVRQQASYTAHLTVVDAYYDMGAVTVTMGGTDITSSVYSDGTISIPAVTGDIVITASGVGGLYQLDQFAHEFTASNLTGTATVSEGNLVRLETTSTSTVENWWTALRPSANNTTAKNNTSNANGATTETIFSVANGDVVKFTFEDVEGTTTASTNWTHQYTCLLKKVGSSPSTAVTSGNPNTTGTVSMEVAVTEDADIGAIIAFVASKAIGYIQYRLKIYVNNVRYI